MISAKRERSLSSAEKKMFVSMIIGGVAELITHQPKIVF